MQASRLVLILLSFGGVLRSRDRGLPCFVHARACSFKPWITIAKHGIRYTSVAVISNIYPAFAMNYVTFSPGFKRRTLALDFIPKEAGQVNTITVLITLSISGVVSGKLVNNRRLASVNIPFGINTPLWRG